MGNVYQKECVKPVDTCVKPFYTIHIGKAPTEGEGDMDKVLDLLTAMVSLATAVVLLVVAKPRKRKRR